MKKLLIVPILLTLVSFAFSQGKISRESSRYVDYNSPVTVLKNALLIDGTGSPGRPNQTVIFSDGKIIWIGNDSDSKTPDEAKVIDLSGKTIMPGLVMLHEHMYLAAGSLDPDYQNANQLPVSFPRLYFAAGATTIRTAGSISPFSDMAIKKDVDAGKFPGPSIDVTAPYLEGSKASFAGMNELRGTDDAVSFVSFWADRGFSSFKAYTGIEKPVLKAAIDEVHRRKLKITGHLCSVTYREAAEMGIDRLEHGFFASSDFVAGKKENVCPPPSDVSRALANLDLESPVVKELLRFLIDKKVGITSTLAVLEGMTTTQAPPKLDRISMYSPDNREFFLKLFAYIKSAKGPTDFDRAYVKNAKLQKMYFDMGGLLAVGTDPTGAGGTIAGSGNWRAIELLVEVGGFTPLEAIKIATSNGAAAIGVSDTVGTIETGKFGDILIIDGKPGE
jgi:imidazolonepropionase-like amidohydrolase